MTKDTMSYYRFKEDINSAPQAEGVYHLLGDAKNVLFVGRAQNIRTAINNSPERISNQSVVYFSFDINAATSEKMAKKQIQEMKPPGNKHGGSFW